MTLLMFLRTMFRLLDQNAIIHFINCDDLGTQKFLPYNLRTYQLWSDGDLASSADIQILDIWVSVCRSSWKSTTII